MEEFYLAGSGVVKRRQNRFRVLWPASRVDRNFADSGSSSVASAGSWDRVCQVTRTGSTTFSDYLRVTLSLKLPGRFVIFRGELTPTPPPGNYAQTIDREGKSTTLRSEESVYETVIWLQRGMCFGPSTQDFFLSLPQVNQPANSRTPANDRSSCKEMEIMNLKNIKCF